MRLIDANTLFERAVELEAVALEQVRKYEPSENPIEWNRWSGILQERTAFKYDLMDAPTVDAVPVVRCQDCRYYDAENHNCLDEMGYARIWNEDDYCSFAERREDETN